MREYKDLLEHERRRLIWVSDAIVDNNPMWLLRLDGVAPSDVLRLHALLKDLVKASSAPVYYEQIFNTLRDNRMAYLLETNHA